jgi:hypothetical protein
VSVTSDTVRTDGPPPFVVDKPEVAPDVYPDAAVFDDWPSPEMVKVRTDADGDAEPVPVTELPATYVEEPELGEPGIVSTVGKPDGSVTVMTVAALGVLPVVRELDEVLPKSDEVPP